MGVGFHGDWDHRWHGVRGEVSPHGGHVVVGWRGPRDRRVQGEGHRRRHPGFLLCCGRLWLWLCVRVWACCCRCAVRWGAGPLRARGSSVGPGSCASSLQLLHSVSVPCFCVCVCLAAWCRLVAAACSLVRGAPRWWWLSWQVVKIE